MTTLVFDRRKLLAGAGGLALFSGLSPAAWAAPRFSAYPFSLGVASGDPWPDGFVIWTRLAPKPLAGHGGMPMAAVEVRWQVAEDERFAKIVQSGVAVARPELGHSVHVEVGGLQPRRPYWYRFIVEGAEASPVGRARTAPAAGGDVDRVRLAVAGCQAMPHGWYEAWRRISQEPDLDAVFHYGDYIYESAFHPAPQDLLVRDAAGAVVDRNHIGDEIYSLDDYRRRYAQYKSDPDLQAAHAAAAFIMAFDDHEVDNNWTGSVDEHGTAAEFFALRRFAAMQAWYEHMPVRRAQFPRPAGLTMFRRLDYGSLLRMHVLDTRSYRSGPGCKAPGAGACLDKDRPQPTMLGETQQAWLADGLGGGARWNLIAQQVFVMPLYTAKPGEGRRLRPGPDGWSGYPATRAQLVKTITERRLTNVVVATGDAHIHAVGSIPVRDDEPDGPAAATEFLATSVTSGGDGEPGVTPRHQTLLKDSPNCALLNDQRGYQTHEITAKEWRTEVKVLDKVQAPGGRLSTLARFALTPDAPKLHRG